MTRESENIISITQKSSSRVLQDGSTIVTEIIEDSRPTPSDTSKHETEHIGGANFRIRRATIVPHGNSLGSVEPEVMTAQAAAAPAAMGHSGTGWDEFITRYILRKDWALAQASARSNRIGKEAVLNELAIVLEEKKTIYQYDVDKAKSDVNNRAQGIFPVRVIIYHPDKTVDSITTESFHGEVIIPPLPTGVN